MHVMTINKKEAMDLQKSNAEYMGEFGAWKGKGGADIIILKPPKNKEIIFKTMNSKGTYLAL